MTAPDTAAIRAHAEALMGFTPGPWKYRPHALDDWGDVRSIEGFRICQARDQRYISDEILAAYRKEGADPWADNARLIAAAPDMHATILALCDALDAGAAREAALAADLSEMTRRRDAWAEKAKGIDEMRAAVRKGIEDAGDRDLSRVFLRGALVESERSLGEAAAEVERLRAALVVIVHTFGERSDGSLVTYPGVYYQDIARAALAQGDR